MKFIILIIISLFIYSCGKQSEPIEFGKDKCAHCEMIISDHNWGGEIVTDKGKVYFFDSIECLAYFIKHADSNNLKSYKYLWTVNFLQPGELLDAKLTYYLYNPELHSPMGLNVASFKTEEERKKHFNNDSCKFMDFNQVISAVNQSWND